MRTGAGVQVSPRTPAPAVCEDPAAPRGSRARPRPPPAGPLTSRARAPPRPPAATGPCSGASSRAERVHLAARRRTGVDREQRLAQHRARGVHRVREVPHLDAHRGEVALQLLALGGPAPVVALEDDVEADVLPGV